ncbi:MAG: acetyltransferase [Deltaproteobacteria bacterium]|nr:acetyltransferase [Deltaproteobacteria bacterium]
MSPKKVAIIGTGGLGRETLWAFQETPATEVVGFLTHDTPEHGSEVCGVPVLGPERWLVDHRDVRAVCCIGDPRARRRVTLELEAEGVTFATAIHPTVARSAHVELGAGCVIGARAVLTTQVVVSDHVIIGAGAIVSHDARIDEFATLAPGVVLTGGVQIGYGAEIGAGATVIPGRSVGRGAVVGAQAVVIEDVEANVIVAGVPARSIGAIADDQRL